MAKYTVTFACGHTATVSLIGPQSGRSRKLAWYETILCDDCRRAERKKEQEAQSVAAAAAARAQGLPELVGSPKQVAWAETIRATLIKGLETHIDIYEKSSNRHKDARYKIEPKVRSLLYQGVLEQIKEKTSAKWFIDLEVNQDMDIHSMSQDYGLRLIGVPEYEGRLAECFYERLAEILGISTVEQLNEESDA